MFSRLGIRRTNSSPRVLATRCASAGEGSVTVAVRSAVSGTGVVATFAASSRGVRLSPSRSMTLVITSRLRISSLYDFTFCSDSRPPW
jgi:hypothetical protein